MRWIGGGLITDETYLKRLCEDVRVRLQRVIDTELAARDTVAPLEQEIAAHWDFAADRAQGFAKFVGRARMLATIDRYVGSGDHALAYDGGPDGSVSEHPHPLLVFGHSGSGKSALIAKAAHEARERHPHAAVVVRFVDATPSSSDTRNLLESLCRQIARAYGVADATLPSDENGLAREFHALLARATATRPLLIFLDALDQLAGPDSIHGTALAGCYRPAAEHLLSSPQVPKVASLRYVDASLPPNQKLQVEPIHSKRAPRCSASG